MKADLGKDISVVNAETENITNLRRSLEVEIICSKSVDDKLNRVISSNKILIIILLKPRLCLL